MAGSSFGTIFKLSSFGESHGMALGGVIDGCPAGIALDIDLIQSELDRRKPGQSSYVTERKEADEVVLLSGIFEGKTTGTPIGFTIQNKDHKFQGLFPYQGQLQAIACGLSLTKKNMAFEITEEEDVRVHEKLFVVLWLVQLLNRFYEKLELSFQLM